MRQAAQAVSLRNFNAIQNINDRAGVLFGEPVKERHNTASRVLDIKPSFGPK